MQGIAEHAVHEAFHFRGVQNDPEAALQHVDHGREIPLIEGGHGGVVGEIGIQREQVHGLGRVRQHIGGAIQIRIERDEVGPGKRVRRVGFNGCLGMDNRRFETALALLVICGEHVEFSGFGMLAQGGLEKRFDHGV